MLLLLHDIDVNLLCCMSIEPLHNRRSLALHFGAVYASAISTSSASKLPFSASAALRSAEIFCFITLIDSRKRRSGAYAPSDSMLTELPSVSSTSTGYAQRTNRGSSLARAEA
jgi:hypothetical protein